MYTKDELATQHSVSEGPLRTPASYRVSKTFWGEQIQDAVTDGATLEMSGILNGREEWIFTSSHRALSKKPSPHRGQLGWTSDGVPR